MSARARRALVVIVVLAVVVAIGLGSAFLAPPAPTLPPTPSQTPAPSTSASEPTATSAETTTPSAAGPVVAWTELSSASVGPVARRGASWTVDPGTEVAYLYGGTTSATGSGGDTLGDLWAYDLAGDAWEPVVGTSDEPPARSGHIAAWVEDVGLVVVGGRDAQGRALRDVWRFDPDSGAWSQLKVVGSQPPARFDACGAAPGDGNLWLSHGSTGTTALDDTWRFEFATGRWRQVSGTAGPGTRSLASCWVDAGGRFVLFGGRTAGGPAGDLWSRSVGGEADSWKRLGVAGPFAARQGAAMAVHLDRVVLVGGGGAEGLLADTGTLAATDRSVTPLAAAGTTPRPRVGAVLVDDPAGERMLLFGGASTDRVLADLWSADVP